MSACATGSATTRGRQRGYFTIDQDDVLHFPGDGSTASARLSVIALGRAPGDRHRVEAPTSSPAVLRRRRVDPVRREGAEEDDAGAAGDFREAWVAKYGSRQGGHQQDPAHPDRRPGSQELSMTAADAQLSNRASSRSPTSHARSASAAHDRRDVGELELGHRHRADVDRLREICAHAAPGPVRQELNRKLFRGRSILH
jgi:hypothetical protein